MCDSVTVQSSLVFNFFLLNISRRRPSQEIFVNTEGQDVKARVSSTSSKEPSLSRQPSIPSTSTTISRPATENFTRMLSNRMQHSTSFQTSKVSQEGRKRKVSESIPTIRPDSSAANNESLKKRDKGERRRRSQPIIDDKDFCPFEKINTEGKLSNLPVQKMDSRTKKVMEKLLNGSTVRRQICPNTGKDWTKEWEDQREAWTNTVVRRVIY